MRDRISFLINRLNERLWVRPLFMTLVSIALVFLARTADHTALGNLVPDITSKSINTLLAIISASMLVIATFSVASMVSAYASASSTATPRTFPLVVADDVSQNALSTFVGAFIFSVVALVAIENSYYDKAGRFALFCITAGFFAIVIVTFVKWVDSIARLGRLGSTVDKAEAATVKALERRRSAPTLGGLSVKPRQNGGRLIYSQSIGYVQRIDLAALQAHAEECEVYITVEALPGSFISPHRAIAYVENGSGDLGDKDLDCIAPAFSIGDSRTFDEDPRFGMVVLSEIASRALSPAVNDPGTAIDIIGSFVRLFAHWQQPCGEADQRKVVYDRIAVPELSLSDMYVDAFQAIARDGAGTVEVAIRLQKAFESLAAIGDASTREVVEHHARQALARAEKALDFEADREAVRRVAYYI